MRSWQVVMMSDSLNTLTISGNLGAAAELRATQSGLSVLTFPVAVNKSKSDNGGYKDETSWITCTMFGRRAEALQPYLGKGVKVAIVGHLRSRSWDKDGERHHRLDVIVDNIELMAARPRQKQQAQQPMQAVPSATAPAALYDEDIPF